MTVFLKAYGVTLGLGIISYTMYMLIENNFMGTRNGDSVTDGFPILLAAVYYIGDAIDTIIFNKGVRPREEIFNQQVEEVEQAMDGITETEVEHAHDVVQNAREWGIVLIPGFDGDV